MKLIGAQRTSQACGVRGEMEEGVYPTDEEQQLKEPLSWCEPVEERGDPGDEKRLGRVTEASPEGDRFEQFQAPLKATARPCVCMKKNPGSTLGVTRDTSPINTQTLIQLSRSSQALSLSGHRSSDKLRKCASWKFLVPVTVSALIIIATLAAFLAVEKSKPRLAAPAPPAGPCCAEGWIGYGGKCYYFSETGGNWSYSKSQCSSLNASLAGIDSEQEKDFLLLYKSFLDRWIGLHREPGQPWRWSNGTEFDLRFPIKGGGDCAYLIDENWVSSSRCGTERLWICSKPDILTTEEGM